MEFLARRLLGLALVLFTVATITFFLMHAVPGGPWDSGRPLPPQLVEAVKERYGLDEPLWRQFLTFMGNALRGDLGLSFRYPGQDVVDILWRGLRVSAVLGAMALALALTVGTVMGLLAAAHRGRLLDRAVLALTTLVASIPGFVVGIMLLALFSAYLGWLPAFGWETSWGPLPRWDQAIMPVVALASFPTALVARVTRAAALTAAHEGFVQAARARGLGGARLWLGHIMPNALPAVITAAGPIAASMAAGSFVVETLFGVPGSGRQFVTAVFQRDYGVVMGLTLFYATLVATINTMVDVLCAAIDPRWRSPL